MSLWHKTAIACGVLPLLVGTIIFVAWTITDIPHLVGAGLVVLFYAGPALFLAGALALYLHVRRAGNAQVPHRRRTILAAAILLLNWPLAFAFSATGYHVLTGRFVTIENDYIEPVSGIVLTDPLNTEYPVEDVAPGSTYSSCFDFAGEGEVEFSVTVSEKINTDIILSYISGSFGGKGKIHITKNGEVEATELWEPIFFREFVQFCVF